MRGSERCAAECRASVYQCVCHTHMFVDVLAFSISLYIFFFLLSLNHFSCFLVSCSLVFVAVWVVVPESSGLDSRSDISARPLLKKETSSPCHC